MDWKQQFKVHDLSFRKTIIILLVIAVCEVILLLITSGPNPKAVSAAFRANCAANQRHIYKHMCEVPGEEGFDLPPEWTVADLIREAVRKDRQSPHPTPEKDFICRNVRDERVFLVRRRRMEVDVPYLVFPASASVVFDESLQEPVPILMCPPGAHGGKRGSMVLYSDGSQKCLSTEEAEKLVSEQSPVPLEIEFETGPGEDGESQ